MRQLALPLDTPGDENPPGVSVRIDYRMTEKSLTEEIGSARVVFGSWRHLFGCWIVDTETNCATEVLPTWPILDRNGIWLPGDQISYGARVLNIPLLCPNQREIANRAFAAFVSSIPSQYRCLAARFDNYQWLVLDLIWQVPAFAYLVDDADAFDRLQKLASRLFCANAPRLTRAGRLLVAREFIAVASKIDHRNPPLDVLGHAGTDLFTPPRS